MTAEAATAAGDAHDPIFEVSGVTLRFGGVTSLAMDEDVEFAL